MNIYILYASAVAAIGIDAVASVDWLPVSSTNKAIVPTVEEIELLQIESWISDRLTVREYGKFDMVEQDNGRLLRWGNSIVPRELEVMLHILNSPVLHDSLYNHMNIPRGILPHFQILGLPLQLPVGGTAHTLAIAMLRNDVSVLQQYTSFKPDKTNWPTYLDNEAAYTYLWRILSHQVRVRRNQAGEDPRDIRRFMNYLYRNEKNELLLFKFRVNLDREKHYKFLALISQWSVQRLPVHGRYLTILDRQLANIDRSNYAEELFDNIGHFSKYVNGHDSSRAPSVEDILALPLLKTGLTKDKSIDVESKQIAKVTLKLVYHLMAQMLEKHAIPAFVSLKSRKRALRVYGVSEVLKYVRINMNLYRISASKTVTFELDPSLDERVEIEEILFEASKNYQPYWSMKNDTLYNKSPDIKQPDAADRLNLLFHPERFLLRLLNIRTENINFQVIHDLLHRIIAPATPVRKHILFRPVDTCRVVHNLVDKVEEQYISLSPFVRERIVAKCRCLLAFLYLFGIPDRLGRLEMPGGWPRNIGSSLNYITEGIGASCGLCNAVLGFLSAIGYPPVMNNMYAWEGRRTNGEAAVYQMLVASNVPVHQKHTEYFDKTLLSYLSGHYKYDDASSLAVGYYLYSGIANPSRLLDDAKINSGIERSPNAIGSKCIDALPFVIEAAKSAMRTKTNISHEDGTEEFRSRRYAEFVKKLARMGDLDGLRVMGDFHFMGHEAGNIPVDVPRALEYWSMAAQNGDVTSALTMANHLIHVLNEENELESDIASNNIDSNDAGISEEQLQMNHTEREHLERATERYLRMAAHSNNIVAAATARFYMYRYGIGSEKDPVAAARNLQVSADRGDVTSQILMGHAYAGMLNDVTPPDGKNIFMALDYYRRAAKSGNIVATFNTAVLTLHGYDLKYNSSVERCKASFTLFHKVGRHSVFPSVVRILSTRAKRLGDGLGYTMLNMFLSEMGDPVAHIAAAKHFKFSNKLCYVDNVPLSEEEHQNIFSIRKAFGMPSGDHDTNGPSIGESSSDSVKLDNRQKDGEDVNPANKEIAGLNKTDGGILHAVNDIDAVTSSSCHLMYARRSANEANGGSPLLLAEALLERNPRESAEWMLEAKMRNESKATYLYAMMLEAGLGVSQDCAASYDYYRSMLDSKDTISRLLGFLCIQRARLLHVLHRWADVYSWFVLNFYDTPVVAQLLHKEYEPCKFAAPQWPAMVSKWELVVTVVFCSAVSIMASIYLKALGSSIGFPNFAPFATFGRHNDS
ncbi:Sel1 repeat-containing protein [Babesia ovis]|uniref:Sel1 repeat-containing protein n=1 Tax=Babesia ovis TaxID=5869 RepID=A0A9W5TE13_BABOV|nr:Sel1 repeat-containing protein [Babesia ovis]